MANFTGYGLPQPSPPPPGPVFQSLHLMVNNMFAKLIIASAHTHTAWKGDAYKSTMALAVIFYQRSFPPLRTPRCAIAESKLSPLPTAVKVRSINDQLGALSATQCWETDGRTDGVQLAVNLIASKLHTATVILHRPGTPGSTRQNGCIADDWVMLCTGPDPMDAFALTRTRVCRDGLLTSATRCR